jgi:sarcosine oxidase subunit alpha
MKRLSQLPTCRIDPEKKVFITYRGKSYQGYEGDTVASLLYANGIRIFSRSLKYHRPRGLYSLDGECSNTTMAIDGIPNLRTETTPARHGMTVKAQNVVGSPEFDLLGIMDRFSRAMPAGFFYHMFHKPPSLWPLALKRIRKIAGLGTLRHDFVMQGRFDEIYPHTDLCVIGGGPAGMSTALAAADQGLQVILIEARPWLGGIFDYRPAKYLDGFSLHERAGVLSQRVTENKNIRVFLQTAVVGIYPDNQITAFQVGGRPDAYKERYVEIRAKSLVVATGCLERPLLFENNERPGVMQVGCAHRLARTWGILPGKNAVFCTGHDLGLEAAIDLFDLGMEVLCVADNREDGQDAELVAELKKRNIPFYRGWVAAKVKGKKAVKAVTISTVSGTRRRDIPCEVLVASAGLTPATGLLSIAQCKLSYDNHTGFFLPVNLPERVYASGRMLGFHHPLSIEISGRLAGLNAAAGCKETTNGLRKEVEEQLATLPGPPLGSKWVSPPGKGKKVFICFDEDATLQNIDQAFSVGFEMPELIKRFTAAGTGPGQGGIPGHNLPLYVGQSRLPADDPPSPTTVRPPMVPVLLATYAGKNLDMSKRTPVHDLQISSGGKMERVGGWRRARYFSPDKSIREEIEAVRTSVAILDASTLGKFRLHGPDALKALQRVYVGDMTNIAEGKVKYSAMCNDDGCLIDDGVVVQRGKNDYFFTTSTARAGGTIEWIRFHTRYDGWDFHLVNLTDAFGVINLAGPKAREVLERATDSDVSPEAFPYAGYRELLILNTIPVRVMRLGFVGELSFELHVPASYMITVWKILEETGKPWGIRNFGLEAQNILRMEKGHVIIGSESEQRTTLHDLGLGFLWHRNKPEAKTVGAAALKHTENQKGRLKLVGFEMEDSASTPPRDGSIIVDEKIRGYVCTARYSHTLNASVGMALVEDRLTSIGERLAIFEDDCNGKLTYARVASMPFYDPEGARLKI